MFEITKYFLPAACFLLITVFFMLLPDLRICKLGGGARRMDRADALVVAGVTIVYAVAAFMGLGNTASPESFVRMENETAQLGLDPDGGAAAKLMIFSGVGIGDYSIDYTGADGHNVHLADLEQGHGDVLKWHEVELEQPVTGGTLRILGRGNVWLGEVAAKTEDGETIALSARPSSTPATSTRSTTPAPPGSSSTACTPMRSRTRPSARRSSASASSSSA